MTEFDGSGFAVVDAFFESKAKPSSDEGVASETATSRADPEERDAATAAFNSTLAHGNKRQRDRLGVGAASTAIDTSPANDAILSNRILQVGKRKNNGRGLRMQDGGDDNGEVLVEKEGGSDSDDQDEEEDMGRTAILDNNKDQSLSSKVPKVSASLLVKQMGLETKGLKVEKKKKKGKKERKKAQGQTAATTQEGEEEDKGPQNETAVEDQSEPMPPAEQEPTLQSPLKRKRKRPKVRSRQKNICKDHREVKPAHLIIGKRTYQGRPLTSATREKLQLGPSKSSNRSIPPLSEAVTEEEQHGSSSMTTQQNLVEAMPLAVEKTLTASMETHVNKPAQKKQKKATTSRAKKKLKYKNLML